MANDGFESKKPDDNEKTLMQPEFIDAVKATFGTPENPIQAIAGDIKKNMMVIFNLNRNMKRAKVRVSELQERIEKMETVIEESTRKDTGNRLDHLR